MNAATSLASPRNATVDVAKFVAALFVVGIHTSLFKDVDASLYFVLNQIVCRLAVPFFATCTGYFLCYKVTNKLYKNAWGG